MPTLIDALITTFTLDNSSYLANAAKQRAEAAKMSIAERQAAKDADDFAKKQTEAFRKVGTELVGLLAIFTAGRGIKQFIADTVSGDRAMGNLARTSGVTTQTFNIWERSIRRVGGSAEAFEQSMQGLTDANQEFQNTGQSGLLTYLRLFGLSFRDAQDAAGHFDPTKLVEKLTKATDGMDPQVAQYRLRQLGLDPGTIQLILQGSKKLQDSLQRSRKLGYAPTDEDIRQSTKFAGALGDMETRADSFGRSILYSLLPSVNQAMDGLGVWLDDRMPGWEDKINAKLKEMIDWIKTIDWTHVWEKANEYAAKFWHFLEAVAAWSPPGWMKTVLGIHDDGPVVTITAPDGSKITTDSGGNPAMPADDPSGVKPDPVSGHLPDTTFSRWVYGHPLANVARPGVETGENAVNQGAPVSTFGSEGVTGPWKALLRMIGISEGTANHRGYNETLGYGMWTKSPDNPSGKVDLTHMTLDQLDKLQTTMINNQIKAGVDPKKASSAAGMYQFTRSTLRDMFGWKEGVGYGSAGSQLFDERFQDQAAIRRAGPANQLTPAKIAQIWASAPRFQGDRGGAYGQGTHASYEDYLAAINAAKQGSSPGQRYSDNSTNGGGDINHNHTETHVGQVVVHTDATDAQGIAKDIKPALAKYAFVSQANTGMTT